MSNLWQAFYDLIVFFDNLAVAYVACIFGLLVYRPIDLLNATSKPKSPYSIRETVIVAFCLKLLGLPRLI